MLQTSVSNPTKKPFSPNSATPASVYPLGRKVKAKGPYLFLSVLADTDEKQFTPDAVYMSSMIKNTVILIRRSKSILVFASFYESE